MKTYLNNRLAVNYLFVFIFFISIFTVNFLSGEASAASQRSKACLRQSTAGAKITTSNGQATARFKIPRECGRQTVSFVSYTAPNGTNGKPYSQQRVHASVTRSLNPGQHTMSVALPDCFYQVDLVRGGVKRSFADGSTYHGEGRFLKAKHGGNKSCMAKPVAKPQAQPKPQPVAPAPVVPKNAVCQSLTGRQTSDRGSLPATFMFTTVATNSAAISSYSYDFGDGNTTQSTSNRVTHTYNQAGTYQVSVRLNSTASGNSGESNSNSDSETGATVESTSATANSNTDDTETRSTTNSNRTSGSSSTSNNAGNNNSGASSGTVAGSESLICRTSVTVTEDQPVQPDTAPQTPAATQPAAEERAQPAPKPADELPDTGAGTLVAFGFGSSFMGALALAYRGRLSSLVTSIISKF